MKTRDPLFEQIARQAPAGQFVTKTNPGQKWGNPAAATSAAAAATSSAPDSPPLAPESRLLNKRPVPPIDSESGAAAPLAKRKKKGKSAGVGAADGPDALARSVQAFDGHAIAACTHDTRATGQAMFEWLVNPVTVDEFEAEYSEVGHSPRCPPSCFYFALFCGCFLFFCCYHLVFVALPFFIFFQ